MPLDLSVIGAGIAPSATLAMDTKAKEFIAAGIDVIKFGVGEPDFDTPEFIRTAAQGSHRRGKNPLHARGGHAGSALGQSLRNSLEDNDLDYDASGEIIVSSGAKQSLLYEALCVLLNRRGRGDSCPSPCWVSYPEMVRMAGGVPVMVHGYEENGFVVTAEYAAPVRHRKDQGADHQHPEQPERLRMAPRRR